ncbi:MAG: endolytic transglycosylase MltG [Cyanobacteria bacterium P01_C01_bin.89]
MKGLKRGLSAIVVVGAMGVAGWQGWAWWSWARSPVLSSPQSVTSAFNANGSGENAEGGALSADPVQVNIERGTSIRQMGQDLEDLGLVRSAFAWEIWTRWLSMWEGPGQFQAGTYEIAPTESLTDIVEKIRSGKTIQQGFTIPEGWSLRQMANYFETQGFFSAEEFLAAARNIPRDRFPWLPQGIQTVEGFLFPETYQVPTNGFTAAAAVDVMLRQFENTVLPLWQDRQKATTPLDLDLKDWVTLASIVEKEAVVPQERSLIAGVFTNRLEKGQRLESDPTVEYGLNMRQTADRPLTLKQVRTPNPYNTYMNAGLPPSAIAAPGKASLEATLNPEPTDYFFFVARYDGTHVFSKTFAEHDAAVKRIRQERNRQRQQP